MDEQNRKIGSFMNIVMGLTLSFCLSLLGVLTSEKGFTLPGFLVSFAVSFVISLFIGFSVRVGMIEGMICGMAGLKEGTAGARVLGSVVSDLIYTPLITFCMVLMAWFMANKQFHLGSTFFKSLVMSLIAAFVIIFIVKPLYLKMAVKKYGQGGK